ncbi:MAG: cytochrome c [Alphaproteobacteria bacterium]|nr:cytochrome c [Alphaproteobacteria bacterium]
MSLAKFVACYGVLVAMSVSTTLAEGDVATGEEIARESCIRCHNVEADGPFKEHPPSFAAIAVYRSEEQIYGRIMFPPLHSSMPQLGYMLSPDNVEHLVAYIQSLETR